MNSGRLERLEHEMGPKTTWSRNVCRVCLAASVKRRTNFSCPERRLPLTKSHSKSKKWGSSATPQFFNKPKPLKPKSNWEDIPLISIESILWRAFLTKIIICIPIWLDLEMNMINFVIVWHDNTWYIAKTMHKLTNEFGSCPACPVGGHKLFTTTQLGGKSGWKILQAAPFTTWAQGSRINRNE